ncbi:hypothetical protein ACE6H2_028032 [Prunus campanulata]
MIVNSQQMQMAFTYCMWVVASNLRVMAPAVSLNTDGIHISASRGIEVKNSIIRTVLNVNKIGKVWGNMGWIKKGRCPHTQLHLVNALNLSVGVHLHGLIGTWGGVLGLLF